MPVHFVCFIMWVWIAHVFVYGSWWNAAVLHISYFHPNFVWKTWFKQTCSSQIYLLRGHFNLSQHSLPLFHRMFFSMNSFPTSFSNVMKKKEAVSPHLCFKRAFLFIIPCTSTPYHSLLWIHPRYISYFKTKWVVEFTNLNCFNVGFGVLFLHCV